jgi:hypothetical protein
MKASRNEDQVFTRKEYGREIEDTKGLKDERRKKRKE